MAAKQDKEIPLKDWAAAKFGRPYNRETLRRWVRACKIHPAPRLVGREYLVKQSAEYIDPSDTDSIIERINAAAKT